MEDSGADSAADANIDGAVPDSGPRECFADEDCPDDVPCTGDLCDPSGRCRHPVDPRSCDDGLFCNGVEICDPVDGCVPGLPETCSDDDVCTIDRCDEEAKLCRRSPRDFDEDGEADFHCEGGTDCDDRDPNRGMSLAEICGDGVDNDCDGEVDELDCGRPAHDICDDALDVSAGGSFSGSFVDVSDDVMTSCGFSGSLDLTYTFTIDAADAPRDVVISAVAATGETLAFAVGDTCGDVASELRCVRGSPAGTRLHQLGAETYSLAVEGPSFREVDFDLSVRFEAPTPVPQGDTCADPLPLTIGTPELGVIGDKEDDLDTSCGFSYRDAVYRFDLAARSDVTLEVDGSSSFVNVSVRPDCVDGATQIRCVSGSPARARLRDLPAGTYCAIVL